MAEPTYELHCTRCSATHPIEVQNEWGIYPGTQGLGVKVVCPSLVDNAMKTAKQVCRGMLVAQQVIP